jgi:hypothetical protein
MPVEAFHANGHAPPPVTLPELRVSRAAALLLGLADGDTYSFPPPMKFDGGCDYTGPFVVRVVDALNLGRLVVPPPPGPPPERVAGAHQSGSGV